MNAVSPASVVGGGERDLDHQHFRGASRHEVTVISPGVEI
jgi:hypothetical protein